MKDLEKMFPEVSSMTLRRDLNFLEQENKIVRTRGGAKSIEFLAIGTYEERYLKKTLTHLEEKNIIASKAVKLISPERSIFLDAGSTSMCLAKMLPDERYYGFTSAPNVAMEVVCSTSSTVNLTGGEVNSDNLAVSGAGAVEFMENVNIDIAFIAVSGFDFKNGFSCSNINDSQLKKAIIKRAAKVVVLMDSYKLGINMPYTFARLSDIDVLVGDGNLPYEFVKAAEESGVTVL
jgi:DeoR/GlpR family transcriptional regulator of sugar metabolism